MGVKKWLTKIKKGLPSFNVYKHNNGAVSITPHLGYQWYKYEGVTSKGCLKRQIHFGWIVWSGQALWKYKCKPMVNAEWTKLVCTECGIEYLPSRTVL